MNCLVAYEDSDSDTEKSEISTQSKHEKSRDGDHPRIYCQSPSVNDRQATYRNNIPELSKHWDMGHQIGLDNVVGPQMEYKSALHTSAARIPSTSLSSQISGPTVTENAARDSLYHNKKRKLDETVSAQGTVKPYIPKRLRQVQILSSNNTKTSVYQEVPVSFVASDTAELPSPSTFYTVSDFIQPYLETSGRSYDIPKDMIFHMNAHSGPVNRVHWCPVRQYSHLLLSASMDNTIKVWNAVDTGTCLRTYSCHSSAVRDAQWSSCGTRILSGGFDSMLYLTDTETGKLLFSGENEFRISCLKFHPNNPDVSVCGGFSAMVNAWDTRTPKIINVYKAAVQQTLDILFINEGREVLTTTDAVSRDSADRTIIAWDFLTAAKISNQIFHERYTCPTMACHPKESVFVAQTNGNYIALFSTQRPYKMNRRKRYEGHKVEGFAVGCEFSPDGTFILTGSSEGKVYFYNYYTSRIAHSIPAHSTACVSINCHPVLPSLLATCDWDGVIKIWQ
ncbi:WD repeat-containing protein 25 [Protopterus annectens]|uniref:WD repeat-containing protein 25 n=1 Tax=Protopterus annectens TaxID=7888 RepID=UPI001CF9F5F5|nr:WD repeat-containing protein 25 [Protopterus annectens]